MRQAIIVAVVAAGLAVVPQAHATAALHVGSHGKRVSNLQWLLSGKKPSHFAAVATFAGKPNGLYGKRTADAVAAWKWRVGYPAKAVNRTAGGLVFDLLLGRKQRPLAWIANAAHRQSRLKHELAAAKLSACQRRVVEVARTQLGNREQPDGSNWGPQVADYQAVTGAYHQPWCASFAEWVLLHAGYGTFANRSAYVPYIADWGRQRGLIRGIARPGVLVLFLASAGHIGVVETVKQHGYFSIEGNYADQVARVYHPFGETAVVFLYLPGCSAAAILRNPNGSVFADLLDAQPGALALVIGFSLFFWFFPQPHNIVRWHRRRRRRRRT